MKRKELMPEGIKKAASVTVLGFISSSVLMGAVGFFLKDTVDKVNNTMDRVNEREVEMVRFDTTVHALGEKLDKLDRTVERTGIVLNNYTQMHANNLSNMTISITEIVGEINHLKEKCDENDKDIQECEKTYRSTK
jgi:chromosome segregation ATPase